MRRHTTGQTWRYLPEVASARTEQVGRRRWGLLALLAIALGLGAAGCGSRRSAPRTGGAKPAADLRVDAFMVMPFTVEGDKLPAWTGYAAATSLEAWLEEVDGLRGVASREQLEWRKQATGGAGSEHDLKAALALGRRLGAAHVFLGALSGDDEAVTVTLSLARVGDGKVVSSERVTGPLSPPRQLQSALALAALRQLGHADKASERSLSGLGTNSLEAWKECAYAVSTADIAKWQQHLEQATRLDPAYAEAQAWLGYYMALNLEPGGRQHAEAALRVKPDYSLAHVALSVAYDQTGRSRDAAEEARRALEGHRTSGLAHWALGTALADGGDPKGARPELELAAKLRPNDFAPREILGNLLMEAQQYAKARDEYRAALDIIDKQAVTGGGWPETRARLESLYAWNSERSGDQEGARAAYERAIALARSLPPDTRARLSLDITYANLAGIYVSQGDTGKAVEALTASLAENPTGKSSSWARQELSRLQQ